MAALVVGDDCKRILYNFCGFAGSAHDSPVFRNSNLYRFPERFFSPKEFILGEAAHLCIPTVVPPFKKPHSDFPQNQEFNRRLSSVRINIEHIFGMLKGRFRSLRGIRTVISCRNDHARVVYWFRATCILHNSLLADKNGYNRTWEERTDRKGTGWQERDCTRFLQAKDGALRREYMKTSVLDHRGH